MRSLDNDKLIEGRPSGGAPEGAARDYLSRPEANQTKLLAPYMRPACQHPTINQKKCPKKPQKSIPSESFKVSE